MKCDHENNPTAFCPHCGRRTSGGPRGEILDYMTKTLRMARNTLERRRAWLRERPGDEKFQRYVTQMETHVRRWERWLKWVEESKT